VQEERAARGKKKGKKLPFLFLKQIPGRFPFFLLKRFFPTGSPTFKK
jgi:hypothetical protein